MRKILFFMFLYGHFLIAQTHTIEKTAILGFYSRYPIHEFPEKDLPSNEMKYSVVLTQPIQDMEILVKNGFYYIEEDTLQRKMEDFQINSINYKNYFPLPTSKIWALYYDIPHFSLGLSLYQCTFTCIKDNCLTETPILNPNLGLLNVEDNGFILSIPTVGYKITAIKNITPVCTDSLHLYFQQKKPITLSYSYKVNRKSIRAYKKHLVLEKKRQELNSFFY